MDRYYAESSSEHVAQAHVQDYIFHDPSITVQTIGHCAAYAALSRYVTRGDELYIAPRNTMELQMVLKNYSTDVIYSLISQTRAQIPSGGFSIARNIASASIEAMLRTSNNAETLLDLHAPSVMDEMQHGVDGMHHRGAAGWA